MMENISICQHEHKDGRTCAFENIAQITDLAEAVQNTGCLQSFALATIDVAAATMRVCCSSGHYRRHKVESSKRDVFVDPRVRAECVWICHRVEMMVMPWFVK